MQPEQQQRIMGYFIEEAKEHLNTIEQGLLNLQSTLADPEMTNELFRAAHSVKGGAAMLGLNSIQRVSHRLEDFFKVLREAITPVPIDQKLESLFLQVFDTLQELLNQLQGPFGLTEDTASATVAEIEPTFVELEHHLTTLTDGIVAASPAIPEPAMAAAAPIESVTMAQPDSALRLIFGSDVPARLREMLQLFRQSDGDAASRQQLQEMCRSLASMGDQFELRTWCHLIESVRQAIACPENTYRTLAPVVIKDIKQAQEKVLAGRVAEIAPSSQLQALLLVPVAPVDEFADLLIPTDLGELAIDSADLEAAPIEFALEEPAAAGATSEGLFDEHGEDSFETTFATPDTNEQQGPEVGMAELNTLADLFEGEVPDLSATWQEEEILNDGSEPLMTHAPGPEEFDDTSDFSDLLFEETVPVQRSSAFSDDDLNALFGDALLEEEMGDSIAEPRQSQSDLAADAADLEDFFGMTDLEPTAVSEVTADLDVAFADLDLEDSNLEDNAESGFADFSENLKFSLEQPSEVGSEFNNLGELFAGIDDRQLTDELPTDLPVDSDDLGLDLIELAPSVPHSESALDSEDSIADRWVEAAAEPDLLSLASEIAAPAAEQLLFDENDALSADLWLDRGEAAAGPDELPGAATSELSNPFGEADTLDLEQIEELTADTEEPDFSSLFEPIAIRSEGEIEELSIEELTDLPLDLSTDAWLTGDQDAAPAAEPAAIDHQDLANLSLLSEPTLDETTLPAAIPDPWDEMLDRSDDGLTEESLHLGDLTADPFAALAQESLQPELPEQVGAAEEVDRSINLWLEELDTGADAAIATSVRSTETAEPFNETFDFDEQNLDFGELNLDAPLISDTVEELDLDAIVSAEASPTSESPTSDLTEAFALDLGESGVDFSLDLTEPEPLEVDSTSSTTDLSADFELDFGEDIHTTASDLPGEFAFDLGESEPTASEELSVEATDALDLGEFDFGTIESSTAASESPLDELDFSELATPGATEGDEFSFDLDDASLDDATSIESSGSPDQQDLDFSSFDLTATQGESLNFLDEFETLAGSAELPLELTALTTEKDAATTDEFRDLFGDNADSDSSLELTETDFALDLESPATADLDNTLFRLDELEPETSDELAIAESLSFNDALLGLETTRPEAPIELASFDFGDELLAGEEFGFAEATTAPTPTEAESAIEDQNLLELNLFAESDLMDAAEETLDFGADFSGLDSLADATAASPEADLAFTPEAFTLDLLEQPDATVAPSDQEADSDLLSLELPEPTGAFDTATSTADDLNLIDLSDFVPADSADLVESDLATDDRLSFDADLFGTDAIELNAPEPETTAETDLSFDADLLELDLSESLEPPIDEVFQLSDDLEIAPDLTTTDESGAFGDDLLAFSTLDETDFSIANEAALDLPTADLLDNLESLGDSDTASATETGLELSDELLAGLSENASSDTPEPATEANLDEDFLNLDSLDAADLVVAENTDLDEDFLDLSEFDRPQRSESASEVSLDLGDELAGLDDLGNLAADSSNDEFSLDFLDADVDALSAAPLAAVNAEAAAEDLDLFLNEESVSETESDLLAGLELGAIDLELEAAATDDFENSLGSDFDLNEPQPEAEIAAITDDAAIADFDLFADAAETTTTDTATHAQSDELFAGLEFDAADLESTTPGEPTELDTLLDEETESGAIDEFADLDNFLGSDMTDFTTSSALTGLDDLATGDAIATSDDEFADLENFLSDTATTPTLDEFSGLDQLLGNQPATTAEFADLENWLDNGVTTPDAGNRDDRLLTDEQVSDLADDFADLEALLDHNTPAPLSAAPLPETVSPARNTDFDELDDLLKDAEEKMGGSPSVKPGRGIPPQNRRSTRPNRGFSEQTMRVPVKHLDNLSNLVGELVVNRNSLEQDQERLRQSLDNLLYQVQQLSDVGQRMQDLYERSLLESSLLASRQNYRSTHSVMREGDSPTQTLSSAPDVEYDPLEMDRFTGFHSLSQEMIELIVRVRESASDIEFVVDETDQVTRMFRQVTTQLQEGLTRSRMVPFAQTADRLPRAVRDISMKVGKQVELVIEGRETLIDKMILEQLYDPMTHLVNNALTHGIEPPEVRRKAGKPPVGRITIRAFHQGNQTIISVSDDGAGINVERVKTKAIEKGLVTQAEARTMSRLDVYDLLFHAGFSTKDQADDFSGRGVGMDVVRTSLSEIRGAVSTDSTPGKGTSFTIRLPLTLSISKALCCISDRARIAFPMDGVEDMLDVPRDRVQTNAEGQPCISWRDSLLPLRPLSELLSYSRHISRGTVYGGHQEDDIVSIVVLRSAGNFLALQVDQVLGEQEIVIKQLEGPVPKPVGVAGATVLGDGRIMPIADVLELIDLSMGRIRRDVGGPLWEQDGDQAGSDVTTVKSEPMVLIVDDSITVRELLSMTFNKVGYRVEQARDGQEAWEKLRSGLPCDIVFCDIEMPRMDGLELLSRIQKDSSLSHLPIAMLTSRGADRHRQMASTLGASGYFTKPYLEEALLDAAQRMLKGEKLL
jgi:chemosensory pili system protein ChpA (sensor histidine kinase/response regulator)